MKRVSKRIKDFNKGRIEAMIRLKYEGMAESLYRFYRGTNHLFYEDIKQAKLKLDSPVTWICGDLHLENFGSFKSDNRLVYFDLNDFDEAVLAPAYYELLRLTTSIFIAFQSLKIEQKKAMNMAQLFLKNYSSTIASGKPNYIEPNTAKGIVCKFLTTVSMRKPKDILKAKAVISRKKEKLLIAHPKHLKLKKQLKDDLFRHITRWLKNDGNSPYNYKVVDAMFRIAGTGSLGVKRYVILLKTLNNTGQKYLLIDMKQAVPSSVTPYLKIPQPIWHSEADRIISIQKRMQNRPPALLSATHFKNEPYVIQEMQPAEDSISFKLLKKEYRDMYQVVDDMAMLTASSHLRSSGRQGSAIADELIAFGKRRDWQDEVLKYAIRYANQVRKDHTAFSQDFKKGLLS